MKPLRRTVVIAASSLLAAALLLQPSAQSQEPPLNVDPGLHGNIAHAQEFTRQAYDAMTAAQQANEYDLGGHAARAKQLLFQASEEMKQSALAANRR
jgi:hypothetical protein